MRTLTQGQVRGHTAEDEGRQEGQRDDEGVEETVVPPANTVSHPGTVMVKALWGEKTVRDTTNNASHYLITLSTSVEKDAKG